MPPPAEAFRWLEKVLASRYFCRSPRLSRFLRFLVDHALNGSANRLKEYIIGVDVFDRDPSYDSRIDPIVRVEARRLRQKLRTYYEGEGCTDPVRIEIPERGYIPNIHYRNECGPDHRESITGLICPVSIAVLSFSGDASVGFTEGLTDEVVYLLSGAEEIRVAAHPFALRSGLGANDAPGTARLFNVDYILGGSVRKENDTVRVCIQLASAVSGFCVWSQACELEVRGTFEAQKHIASQITTGLRAYLRKSSYSLNRGWRAAEPLAHALYSEGRMFLNSRTQDGICQSIQCFRQLINSCPQFALAYAGLADAYSLGARYNVLPHQESWERARSAALNAVQIDYSLAEAHTSLGFVDLHYRRDWGSAEREFCTAILLNPGYAPARQWYGWLLAATGHQEMAITAVRQAIRMDPLSPNANADLALTLYFSRQYEEAIKQCEKTLALQPGFYRAHQLSGIAHLQKGDVQHAVEHLQSAVVLTKGAGRASVLLASALIATGKIEEARQVFAKSIEARSSKASAIEFAIFFTAIGDLDSTFQWLERAYEEQDAELLWLSIDPIYDNIRQDPRFSALLARIGKPPVSYSLHEFILSPSAANLSIGPSAPGRSRLGSTSN